MLSRTFWYNTHDAESEVSKQWVFPFVKTFSVNIENFVMAVSVCHFSRHIPLFQTAIGIMLWF